MENINSEQQLKQLLNDGKINRDEYQELLDSMKKPILCNTTAPVVTEPKFEAFRIRIMTGSIIICVLGLPIGLYLNIPFVWILSIAGLVIGGVKLSRIKNSWLSKLLNRQN